MIRVRVRVLQYKFDSIVPYDTKICRLQKKIMMVENLTKTSFPSRANRAFSGGLISNPTVLLASSTVLDVGEMVEKSIANAEFLYFKVEVIQACLSSPNPILSATSGTCAVRTVLVLYQEPRHIVNE